MSDRPENGDRVSNRQLYDALAALEQKFATKGDLKVYVLGGLLAGQAVASGVTAAVTRLSPPQQVAWVASNVYHLFT